MSIPRFYIVSADHRGDLDTLPLEGESLGLSVRGAPINWAPTPCAIALAIGPGASPSHWGDSFFRAINNSIPSFTGLAPQMLEDNHVVLRVAFGRFQSRRPEAIAMLDLRETSG